MDLDFSDLFLPTFRVVVVSAGTREGAIYSGNSNKDKGPSLLSKICMKLKDPKELQKN